MRGADDALAALALVRAPARAAGRHVGDDGDPSDEELLASLGVAERVIPGLALALLEPRVRAARLDRRAPPRRAGDRQVVDERVLGPLGLARTTWTPSDPSASRYLVDPYSDARRRTSRSSTRGSSRDRAAVEHGRRPRALGRVPLEGPIRRALARPRPRRWHASTRWSDVKGWRLGWGLGLSARRGAASGSWPVTAARCPASSPRWRSGRGRARSRSLTNSGARAEPGRAGARAGGEGARAQPEPPEEWRPGAAARGGRRRSSASGGRRGTRFTFAWRGGRLEARLDGSPAWRPPDGVRAGGAGPLADGLGPRARRVAARPSATATATVATAELGGVPVHPRSAFPYLRVAPATRTGGPASTFSRAARRAGKIAATMPTMIAATANTMICPTGSENSMNSTRATSSAPRTIPSTIPSDAADQRRDHALVADHPPHLAPRHPDRAQHPELARPLEHGQHERVDDPEQADDDGEREQHVEDVEDRAEARRSGCR